MLVYRVLKPIYNQWRINNRLSSCWSDANNSSSHLWDSSEGWLCPVCYSPLSGFGLFQSQFVVEQSLSQSDTSQELSPEGLASSDQKFQSGTPLRGAQWSVLWTNYSWLRQIIFTYKWDPVCRRRQNFNKDKLQDCNGEQNGDLEAQLLTPTVRDQERSQVETQEEEDRQQEVDNIEEWPPLHGDL